MHPHAALSSLQRQPPCSALATSRPPRRRCTRAVHAYQQGSPYEYAAAPAPTPTSDVADIVSFAKRRLKHRVAAQGEPAGPVGEFMHKVRLAWRIFFPEQPRLLTPKEEGKHRLRMILVADRCALRGLRLGAWEGGVAPARAPRLRQTRVRAACPRSDPAVPPCSPCATANRTTLG